MKRAVWIVLVLWSSVTLAQKVEKPSDAFVISGEVKAPVTVTIAGLGKWSSATIGDMIITNHLGEKKSEAKGLKGVLLKDVLGSVGFNNESPRVLSEYYIVCKANDGYTVVYSWNEIFNNPSGDSVFIVTEKNGKQAAAMDDSILMVSSKDFKTGRRHLKAMITIEVKRAR